MVTRPISTCEGYRVRDYWYMGLRYIEQYLTLFIR